MTEEGETPEVPETPPTVPPSLVSADGSLVDGWQQYAPDGFEDLKDDKTLSTMKNVWNLGKSYVHVRKQVPLDKMPRPNENWGDEEWNDFYKAAGRPETPKDYGDIPKPESWNDDFLSWDKVVNDWQDTFHKLGLTPKQVEGIRTLNADHDALYMKAAEEAEKDFNTRLWDELHGEWGRAYEQRVERGRSAIERGTKGNEAFLQRILNKANKDADWIRFLANIEDHFSESGLVEGSSIPTPDDLQEQIDKLMADPRLMDRNVSQKVRQTILDKIMRLREQMNKDKQPVT
jgi:hypothetical protein